MSEMQPAKWHLARVALLALIFTFLLLRTLALLNLLRKWPDLYTLIGGHYLRHPSVAIVPLIIAGAYLLLGRPGARALMACALVYGAGVALGLDEIGTWVQARRALAQRMIFDIVVIASGFVLLLSAAPRLRQIRIRHILVLLMLAAELLLLILLAIRVLQNIVLPKETPARDGSGEATHNPLPVLRERVG